MSRVTLNNGQLYELREDIYKQSSSSPSFRLFNKEKIRRFFDQNKLLLKILDDRIQELLKKHAVHDEAGSPVLEKKDDKEFYTFLTPEKEKEYQDELKEFMQREIRIEL